VSETPSKEQIERARSLVALAHYVVNHLIGIGMRLDYGGPAICLPQPQLSKQNGSFFQEEKQ